MVDGDDLFGNGVNVAARMEGLAEPGAICVSGNVQEHIGNSLDVALEDLGEQTIKNIDRPVRCYRVHIEPDGITEAASPPLPDKPSIAVLPFTNMSRDPDQEYFADGITEDIITALSRIRQFFVIARNTTFTYKGKAVDVQAVARDLGVRYVLEGGVRKAGNRVRITAQLIDGDTGNHIWAERYDRELDDVFAVQDELALTLCGAIEPELAKSEQQRISSKAPENMDAWDYCQRGMWLMQRGQKDEITEARGMFERAMELDPGYCRAFVGYVGTYAHGSILGFLEGDRDKALRAARRAVELDSEDAWARWALGAVYRVGRDPDAAILEFSHAIQLNPSFAEAHAWLGDSLSCAGRAEEAVPCIEQAIRLSPRDPMIGITHNRMGRAYLFLRQYDKAVEWSKSALRHQNVSWPSAANLASALSHLGRQDEARRALDEMQRLQPGTTISFIRDHTTVTNSGYMDHLIDGLRKAGLPE
jgi:TolB-like protein